MRSKSDFALLAIAGIFGAIAIGLSALVTHFKSGPEWTPQDHGSIQLALQFLMLHALAILSCPFKSPAWIWAISSVLFSGGILIDKFTPLNVGLVTPWGGTGLIAGWLLLSIFALKRIFSRMS